MKRAEGRSVLLVFGVASCLVLLTTTQRALMALAQHPLPRTRLQLFVADAAHYYLWALSAFGIYWIVRRLIQKNISRTLLFFLHVLLAFAFAIINILFQAIAVSIAVQEPVLKIVETNFFLKLAMRIAFYYLIVIACSVLIEFKRRREEELKARKLETRLALAQFQVLKSRLSPQFLTETLRSISNLMQSDIEEADRLTARLGDFLRFSLESSCASYVPLQDEIDLVKSYIDIRRFVHPELELLHNVDPHLISLPVPSRIILDLVQRAAPTQPFEFSASVENDRLSLVITRLSEQQNLPSEWQRENQRIIARVPLVLEVESESADGDPYFESLDDFHRSLARKETMIRSSQPSWRRRFWVTLGVWTLACLFFFSTEIMTRMANGQPLMFFETLKDSLAWYWWAAFTPVIFFLGRKFPIRSASLKKSISVHLLFSFVISFGMVFLYLGQRWLLHQDLTSATLTNLIVSYPYLFDALTYWAVLGVHEGLLQRWQYLQQDVRTARLRGNLMEAQVQALKMQLHPHFLFNALNSISELMHEDRVAAEEMLKRLESFIRLTFQSSDVQEITLSNELDFLRNYLDIQQVRFQNRLRIELNIEPRALKDRVPNLILQPIVENAIQHGVSPRVDSGKVEIRAFHRDGNLFLEVEDDGPGLSGGAFREGIGMSNTRMRLKHIYGTDCRFGIQNNPRGGLIVTLQIPATETRHEQPH